MYILYKFEVEVRSIETLGQEFNNRLIDIIAFSEDPKKLNKYMIENVLNPNKECYGIYRCDKKL